MMANNVSVRLGIPYIYGGSLVDSVGVGPLVIPGKTKDFSHVAPELDDTENAFTEAFDSSLVSTLIDPYNALAASFTALECVKYLTGFSEPTLVNKIMIINLKNYETTMGRYLKCCFLSGLAAAVQPHFSSTDWYERFTGKLLYSNCSDLKKPLSRCFSEMTVTTALTSACGS